MSFMMGMVEKRKAFLNSVEEENMDKLNNNIREAVEDQVYENSDKPRIFIDRLLKDEVNFSMQDIKDHVFTMVSAVSR